MTNATLYCSFCGKSEHDVRKLIAGPNVLICNECVDLCVEIAAEELPSPFPSPEWRKWAWQQATTLVLATPEGLRDGVAVEALAARALAFVFPVAEPDNTNPQAERAV